MKTIQQWLKELPKEIRPIAYKPMIYHKANSLSEALVLGCEWKKQKDGEEFYHALYLTLKWAEND